MIWVKRHFKRSSSPIPLQ